MIMFDMIRNSGVADGYRLTIQYSKTNNKFQITGYIVRRDRNNVIHLEQDGETISFDDMNEAIKSITEYPN